ncbi:MAG TPA: Type 1 glutamine amidotransferase-like domain-containing protein [Polyangia bacterium]
MPATKSVIHLVGGGPGALLATRNHIKRAVAAVAKKKPLVAYVGVASNDNLGFQKMLSAAFLGTGARVEMAKLARKTAKVSNARALLADCDLVFMSGGDVEHGMNLLNERGVADELRALAAAGKPFLGISAGSIMTCKEWVRFPGDHDAHAEVFACLGIAPVHMDAHSEADDWPELRTLVTLLGKKDAAAIGYGVPSKGCLRVELAADGAPPKLKALGAEIARIAVNKAGAPVDRTPLKPRD